MADTTHHDSPEAIHYHTPDDRVKRRTMSFGAAFILIALIVAIGVLVSKINKQETAMTGVQAQLTQANSETTTARADAARANAKLTDLQTQLASANKQALDLQGQIKTTQSAGSELQAQLDKAQADLKSQQDKAQSQSTEVQAQMAQATTAASSLRSELEAAKKENADLKAQLDQAKTAATQAPAAPVTPIRSLPLTTEFKKSFFGGKITLQMKNTGTDPLMLSLQVTGSDKTPSQSTTIAPGDTFKLDGVAAGATIVVQSDGFTPITLTAQ